MALLAALLSACALAGLSAGPASRAAAVTSPRPALADPAHGHPLATGGAAVTSRAASAAVPARPVVVVGVPGLRWSDVSPAATPTLWRLAAAGSAGNLVVHTVTTLTCPADGWLTLNGGARAGAPHPDGGPCPPLPAVDRAAAARAEPVPASIPALPGLVAWNSRLKYHYDPDWGLLASAAGPGNCALAVGPGAALALAAPTGRVANYLPAASAATRQALGRCPLTVVDLGAVPPPGPARSAAVSADDRALARLGATLPPGTTLMVVSLADDAAGPHLRPVIIDGTGYARGLLSTASTRQPGLAFVTDLTPTVLELRGQPASGHAVGKPLRPASRGSLAGAIRGLIAQDTAGQVYRTTFGWFFAIFSVAGAVVFGLIALLYPGRDPGRRRRRRAAAAAAGVALASVPAGTFLASLVPWWTLPHPAVLLYLLAAAWAAAIATVALAGPWRRDPMGPAGVVGAITVAVVGLDVMTGSRLQLSTPFGLNVLWGGRIYGADNNTVGLYAACSILCAAWLAGLLQRSGRKRAALAAAAAVTVFAVVASGWPGFGAKVGGTIASVPGFVLLLMAVAGVRFTVRRVLLAAVSGVLVIVAFGLVSYFLPVAHSDISAFVGQVLHGGGGGTLQRKISTNLSSLTGTPYAMIIPLVVAALGVLLLRPGWFGAGALNRARQQVPLLGVSLAAIWLTAVLGWFAEDSGVAVPAAMLPLVLPLVIAIVSAVPDGSPAADHRGEPATASPGYR
jgi:hypothetical protein